MHVGGIGRGVAVAVVFEAVAGGGRGVVKGVGRGVVVERGRYGNGDVRPVHIMVVEDEGAAGGRDVVL